MINAVLAFHSTFRHQRFVLYALPYLRSTLFNQKNGYWKWNAITYYDSFIDISEDINKSLIVVKPEKPFSNVLSDLLQRDVQCLQDR